MIMHPLEGDMLSDHSALFTCMPAVGEYDYHDVMFRFPCHLATNNPIHEYEAAIYRFVCDAHR